MVASAQAGAFDVLVVGYVSRFLRNLKQTLIAVEDHLHAAGVVVLFADERLLSSDPSNWDQFVREAHEAEAYSRKLSKRVGEGYAAKRRRLGVPGREPGAVRHHPRGQAIDAPRRRGSGPRSSSSAYTLAAAGSTDWEVAAQTGLAKTHVGELLTNPIYAGRLRTGETAGIAPIVDPALWSTVQTMRERRRTRSAGTDRQARLRAAPPLFGCERFLYGDVGRYRHPAPTCEAFLAATPFIARHRAVPRPARQARPGPLLPAGLVRGRHRRAAGRGGRPRRPDDHRGGPPVRRGPGPASTSWRWRASSASARRPSQRLAKTRDIGAWQATMLRLDAEARARRAASGRTGGWLLGEVVAYLRSLPSLWTDAGPDGRRALATALFAKHRSGGVREDGVRTHAGSHRARAQRGATRGARDSAVRSVSLVGARGLGTSLVSFAARPN